MNIRHFLTLMLLTTASGNCIKAYCIEKTPPSTVEIQQAMRDIQKMNDSMKTINALFTECKMKNECILKGLHDLAQNKKDPLAQSLLDEFSKQPNYDISVMSNCFESERLEVNNAMSICTTQSHSPPLLPDPSNCIEKALIKIIDTGNGVAELTLMRYYEIANETEKLQYLQEKLTKLASILREREMKKCLKNTKK